MTKFEAIDLFCGAGGTTTGLEQAQLGDKKLCKVIACINHDEYAIKSHRSNYPNAIHFTEDIKEFMMWGDIDENGKPISKLKGKSYLNWVNKTKSYGYDYDWRLLNSADFGAYTNCTRYFGCFAKKGFPILFPETTHCKGGDELLGIEKWKAVKEVLNFEDKGISIFEKRKGNKSLCENTMKRIYAGLVKFVGQNFIQKYFSSNKPETMCTSIDEPAHTLTTKDRFYFITNQYSVGGNTNIEQPNYTITTIPKSNLVELSYIMNTNFSNIGQSHSEPLSTILANHKYHYLVSVKTGSLEIKINDSDSEFTKKIKEFMMKNNIIDIKMRMLSISELIKVQGFPDGYILEGTQAQKKKYIGNSVVPIIAKKWIEALAEKIKIKEVA